MRIGIARRLLPFLGSCDGLWCAPGILLMGRFTLSLFDLVGAMFIVKVCSGLIYISTLGVLDIKGSFLLSLQRLINE